MLQDLNNPSIQKTIDCFRVQGAFNDDVEPNRHIANYVLFEVN